MDSKRFILKDDEEFGRRYLLDTLTDEVLGYDYGEPEDNSFYRDWEWVPSLLNELADEIEELKKNNCKQKEEKIKVIK